MVFIGVVVCSLYVRPSFSSCDRVAGASAQVSKKVRIGDTLIQVSEDRG